MKRKQDEINGRGHLLASIMLGSKGRKQPESTYGPLFDDQKKLNVGDLRGSILDERVKNDKTID